MAHVPLLVHEKMILTWYWLLMSLTQDTNKIMLSWNLISKLFKKIVYILTFYFVYQYILWVIFFLQMNNMKTKINCIY